MNELANIAAATSKPEGLYSKQPRVQPVVMGEMHDIIANQNKSERLNSVVGTNPFS